MSDLKYNFLENNYVPFNVYESVEPPEVTLPLMEESPIDVSDFATSVRGTTPIATNNIRYTANINNPEPVEITTPKAEVTNPTSVEDTPLPKKAKHDLAGNKKKAMEFFQNKGLSAHAAAGLVGNFLRESQLNPTALNKGSGAYGIAQWLGSRKKNLFAKYGRNPTFEQQLNFVWEELNSPYYKKGLDLIRNSKNVDEAAANVFGWYEFSVGPQRAILEMKKWGQDGQKSYNQGIKFARSLLS